MKRIRPALAALLGAALLLQSVVASAAFESYVSVKGKKQGALKAGSTSTKHPGTSPVLKFEHGVVQPRDINAGMASGKRQHEPVMLTMKLDAASKQPWVAAKANNEVLTSVTITSYRRGSAGGEEIASTAELTNATIVRLEDVPPGGPDMPADANATYVKVTLDFEAVHVTSTEGGKVATDMWSPGA